MLELGIVETRAIIRTIAEKYAFDFSDYALTSFKQRLERSIALHNIKYIELFVNKILEDKHFFEMLLSELEVPSTEMFRDPSLWRILRDDIIPALLKDNNSCIRVYLPNSVSGDELFSLCILLDEMNVLDQVKISVSALSQTSLNVIQSGYLAANKLSISTDNYIRANGKKELSCYYSLNKGDMYRDKTLLRNVTFFLQPLVPEPLPQPVKLILYRNKMIYFNQTLQTKILKNFEQTLNNGSYMIIGTKESLGTFYGNNEFTLISSSESIYKRKG